MIDDQPVGPGTDLWAVGVILYKMYSGTIPFKSNDEEELYLKIKEEEITFP
jgi:serine/threonine protein kinase